MLLKNVEYIAKIYCVFESRLQYTDKKSMSMYKVKSSNIKRLYYTYSKTYIFFITLTKYIRKINITIQC